MDPTEVLRRIDAPSRITLDAERAIAELHEWLSTGNVLPNWERYPRGTRRFRRRWGLWFGM